MSKTYGNLYFNQNEGRWEINKAEPHICIKLKAIFNKLPKTSPQPFKFTNSPEVCHDLIWFTERYPLDISDADLKLLQKGKETHISYVNELETIMLPEYVPHDVQLKDGYAGRHYQLNAKDVFLKCKRLLIGDDIGLGKTMIAILAMLHKETLPFLVVVQTHLPKQWNDEINKFTNLKVHQIKGTKPYNLPPADVYIIKYSCLTGWVNVFEKGIFKSACFDECQELRRDSSNRYSAASVLSANISYCLGLSASPMYNYGDEIYNVIDCLNPGSLGERYDFYREYMGSWEKRSIIDPASLGSFLRSAFLMLRRTRKEVFRELPPINKIVYTVGYDEIEVQKSDAIAKQLAIKATTGTFMERGAACRELDIFVRQSTGIAKAKGVADFVRILLDNNEPIVLAAWHRQVYDILLKELSEYNPVMFTGTESATQKEKAKQDFIDGKTNLFILSLRSGIGLDGLQKRCNTVIFSELDWSNSVMNQVIGRVARDGQENQVTAIFLIGDFGSDPLIVDLLGLKASQQHGIMNPLDLEIPKQYSDDTRLKLLAQQYLKKKDANLVENIELDESTEQPIESTSQDGQLELKMEI